jgi:hypothetical protein
MTSATPGCQAGCTPANPKAPRKEAKAPPHLIWRCPSAVWRAMEFVSDGSEWARIALTRASASACSGDRSPARKARSARSSVPWVASPGRLWAAGGRTACSCCASRRTATGLLRCVGRDVRPQGPTATENLLLNRFSPWADVASFLPFEGRVFVTSRGCARANVRIPRWAKRSAAEIRFPVATKKVSVSLPSVNARAFRGAPTVTGYFRGSTGPSSKDPRRPWRKQVRMEVQKPIRW